MLRFIKGRLLSFKWAFKGLADLFAHHPNAQVHLLATIVVIPLGFFLRISAIEWCLVVLCIALVLALEALNSALEYLCDKVSLEQDPLIGKAKDIAAGGVLIAAMGAALVGGIVFVPKLLLL